LIGVNDIKLLNTIKQKFHPTARKKIQNRTLGKCPEPKYVPLK